MRSTLLTTALLALALAGCAQPQQRQKAAPPVATSPTPRCSNDVECQRMWVAAQEQIQQLSGMRLRMVNDTRIETFPPVGRNQMTGGSVVKVAVAPGVYEFRAEIFCRPNVECSDLNASGVQAFNAGMYFSADPPWKKK